MRCPSKKRLMETFNISGADANLLRALCAAAGVPGGALLQALVEEAVPQTAAYVRQMHSSPYNSAMWRRTVALDAISHLIDGYGVEALGPAGGGSTAPPYEYVNMGDPYNTTLIYKLATDNLSIGTWGDIAERHPSW